MPKAKASSPDGLTDRQRAFVGHYIKTLNATQSALKAGYSKRTAQVIGYENLLKPAIKAALATENAKRHKASEITRERILEGFAEAAFSPVDEPLKWSDRNKALDSLAKSFGMYDDKGPALTVSVNINDSASIAREIAGRITGIAARLGAGGVPSQSDAGGERGTPLELAPFLGKTKPDSSAG